jgi:mannonate dehydratase
LSDDSPILLAHVVPWDAGEDDLQFLRQIGLRHARLNYGEQDPHIDRLRAVQQRFETFGIRIVSGWHFAYRSLRVQLGQDGRDEDIDTYRTFLRSCGELGIGVAPYDFHPANTYTTGHVERRGYTAREFSEKDFRERVEEPRFEREYDAAEIWQYYTYFVDATLPVAAEAGVKMSLHPDDPPLAMMNGVAKLFVHYEGYRRAEQLAKGSPAWGVRLCVGTWSEGGDAMGKDTLGMIEDFGRRGKIYEVDFRNVSSPMPHFVETFPDDGYVDMYAVMRALRSAGFRGPLVPDHIPKLAGDAGMNRAGIAYCIAYIRALIERADAEVGQE